MRVIILVVLFPPSYAPLAQEGPSSAGKRQLDFALGLYQRGDYRDALTEFEAYLSNPEWREKRDIALYFSGESGIRTGLPQKALKFYEELIEVFPDSEYRDLSLYRAAAIHIESRNGQEAVEALKPLLEKNLDKDLESGVWYSLGAGYSLVGDSTQSIRWWKQVYEKAPESPEGLRALIGIGFESARLGDCGQAVGSINSWMGTAEAAASPSYPEALKRLAECEEQLGEKDSALKRWKTLLEIKSASSFWEEGISSGSRLSFDLSDWESFERLSKKAETQLAVPQ